MFDRVTNGAGRFCWLDLAASDAEAAKTFYREMFSWTSHDQIANGGCLTRLQSSGRDVGSLYQLRSVHLARGVPSHWTPYIQVHDVDESAKRAASCGGEIVVRPFTVSGGARIALITDSVGAIVGLWEPMERGVEENGRGENS